MVRVGSQNGRDRGGGCGCHRLAAPIRGQGGEWLGTVTAQVSLPVLEDVFASTVVALQAQHGTTAVVEYQFLAGDGTVIADSMLREELRVNLRERKLPSALLVGSGPSGYVEETHIRRGIPVITGYAKTKGLLSWGVLVRMNHDDVLTPIRQFLWKLALVGGAMWLPMVALLLWTGARLQRISVQATKQAEQLTATLTSVGDGVVAATRNGSITFMNPLAEHLTGWEQKDAIGVALPKVVQVVNEETKRAIENPVASVNRQGGGVSLGKRLLLITREGKELSIEGNAAPIRDGHGAVAGIVLALRDDRPRRRAEKRQASQLAVSSALVQSKTLADAAPPILRAVCETTGWDMGAVWLVEPDQPILRCETAWLAKAVPAQDFVAATCAAQFQSGIGLPGRVWASGKPAWLPDVLKDSNFPRAPIAAKAGLHAAFAFPIKIGDEVLGVIEFFSREVRPLDAELLDMMADVGIKIGQFLGRLRMAEQAEESEERFRLAIDHAADAILFLNDRHIVQWANCRTELITGQPMETLIGSSLMEAFANQPMARSNLAAIGLGRPVPPLMEFEIFLKDGRALWLEVTSTAVRKGEAVVGCLLVMRDQTERKHTEQTLRQSERMASLGTLLDGVAHELNNPLFMIAGYAQLAAEELKQGRSEGLADELSSIQEAAQRAAEIVQRTLAVSRSSGGQRQACQVNGLVQRTLDLAANDLAIHQIRIQTHLQGHLPPILADANDVVQVLLSLITNAQQAMASAHGKGTLTVTTALAESPRSRAAAPGAEEQRAGEIGGGGDQEHWIEIRIQDDGLGIAPEHQARLFEPFFTLKPAGQSRGLGLSIARRIVSELSGTVTVESEVGRGAAFIVRLPPMLDHRAEPPEPRSETQRKDGREPSGKALDCQTVSSESGAAHAQFPHGTVV
nr:PAS domain S-box protein [Nitrospirota bacterium]